MFDMSQMGLLARNAGMGPAQLGGGAGSGLGAYNFSDPTTGLNPMSSQAIMGGAQTDAPAGMFSGLDPTANAGIGQAATDSMGAMDTSAGTPDLSGILGKVSSAANAAQQPRANLHAPLHVGHLGIQQFGQSIGLPNGLLGY